MKKPAFFLLVIFFGIIIQPVKAQNDMEKKGFDLSNSSIPVDKIVDGGPPRDGIPSIDKPNFLKPDKVDFLDPSDRILGVTYNYISKAYPVKILNWHEIVNDYFGKKPVVVTYCPLCGSGMAFNAHIEGEDRTFGVSGLLYNNDVLLYDRQSESLWSQIMGEAVSGPLKGTEMEYIQTTHTTWKKWKQMNPYSQVLSKETGYTMNYEENPYGNYEKQERIVFPSESSDDRYHPKAWTLGIEVDGKYKAYPFEELKKTDGTFHDTFAGKEFTIEYNKEHRYAVVKTPDNEEYPSVVMYWFAWTSFHPDTEVYQY